MTKLIAHGFQIFTPLASGRSKLQERLNSLSLNPRLESSCSLDTFNFEHSWSEGDDPAIRIIEILAKRLKLQFGYSLCDMGVFLGTSRGAAQQFEHALQSYFAGHPMKPSTSPSTTAGVGSQVLASLIESRGMALTISSTCTSSMHALDCAVQFVRNQNFSSAVVAGVEACSSPFVKEMLCAAGVHAKETLTESQPCVSFHPRSKGMVLGEGGAAFVLSSELDYRKLTTHEKPRIYIDSPALEIIDTVSRSERGYGRTGISENGKGIQDTINLLLEKTRIPKESVKVLFAHGSCTQLGDSAEYKAYVELDFDNATIHSAKWLFGHQLGASGATLLTYAAMCYALETIPASPLSQDLPRGVGVEKSIGANDIALVISLGFGGAVSVAAIRGV